MDCKRKRRESESYDGLEGQLCEKCRSIFATLENMQMLVSDGGLKHYTAVDLAGSAKCGCMICNLLCDKLRPQSIYKGRNQRYLYLSALSKNGTAIRSVTKSRYPGPILGMRFLKAKWSDSDPVVVTSGIEESYTFDIIPLHDSLKKWGFQFVPLKCQTSSESVMREVKQRLKVCQSRHRCSKTGIPYLPTRVIDVGCVASRLPPYLYISPKSTKGSYVALSYRWGGEQEASTTSKTLHAYTRKLPVENLPRTTRDALTITQNLGIRYLWIDAFCIIQDSPQDKAKEIDTMGTVYQNATVTIAASCAKSVDDGFLQQFSRQHSPSLLFKLPTSGIARVAIADVGRHWIRGPLDERAWAFQEFHLSPRLLLYGYHGDVRWNCQSAKHVPLLWQQKPSPVDPLWPVSRPYTLSPIDLLANGGFKFWTNFIETFSERDLTHAEDRLPALVGIVRYLKGCIQDDYLAGTWRKHLIEHLIWAPHPSYQDSDRYTPCSAAPSWSWASVNKPVLFHRCRPEVQTEVKSCKIEPIDNKSPFGQVREGKLTIRTLVSKPLKQKVSWLRWNYDYVSFILSWDEPFKFDESREIGSKEFELVRLALSHELTGPMGDKFYFFRGIVVVNQQDGKYKRVGSFAYRYNGKLFRNSEGFYETGDFLSQAWAVKEVTII